MVVQFMCVCAVFFFNILCILQIWNNFLATHLKVDAYSEHYTKRWLGPLRAVPGQLTPGEKNIRVGGSKYPKIRLHIPVSPCCLFTYMDVNLDSVNLVGDGVIPCFGSKAHTLSLLT